LSNKEGKKESRRRAGAALIETERLEKENKTWNIIRRTLGWWIIVNALK
jgi:hypothetical protein